jgi:hypothetical protein
MNTYPTIDIRGRSVPADSNGKRGTRKAPTPLRWAYSMSWIVAALMIAASLASLLIHDIYKEGAWAREALRGGDLVTLLLAAPLLIGTLILARRGSHRAHVVWMGVLAYSIYNYAYYVFGATFNDLFMLHIALFSLSVFSIACALPSLDASGIANRLRTERTARWVGGFLAIVGLLQGLLWVFVVLRNAFTGELIKNIPVSGQHLVFALDLGLLVPSLIVAGVLLFRRTPIGYLLGGAMAVMGAAYQVNMMVAGVFQSNANVPGTKAFAPESIFLTTTFLIAAVVLLRGPGRTVDSTG